MIAALQPGDPAQLGDYRLLGRLGAGAMGQMFLGRSADGRCVAVKTVRPELAASDDFRARLRDEAAAARRVVSAHTVLPAEAGETGPAPWLATPYIGAPSLAEAVAEHGPLPVPAVLRLAAALAVVLRAMHAAGVVHRDLGPGSVLLAADGPRLLDSAVARAAEASPLAQAGLAGGTAGFLSPEQAEGRPAGPASDVFSLGALIAFAAAGEGPFGSGSGAALLYRTVHARPALDRVPAQVRPLAARCLEKDPAERARLGELLDALGQPGPAAVPGWLPAAVAASLERYQPPAGAAGGRPGRENRRRPDRKRLDLPWLVVTSGLAAAAVAVMVVPGPAGGGLRLQTLPQESRTVPSPAPARPRAAAPGGRAPVPGPAAASGAAASGGGAAAPAGQASSAVPVAATVTQATADPGSGRPGPATAPARHHPAPLPVPAHVTAAPAGPDAIKVSWTAPLHRVTGFRVASGCPAPGCPGSPGSAAGSGSAGTGAGTRTTGRVTSAVFAATPGGSGCFRVRSVSDDRVSPWSGYACAATPPLVLAAGGQWADTGVTADAGDQLGIAAAGQLTLPAGQAVSPAGDATCTPSAAYPAQAGAFPAPGLPCWSLVGRIGAGPVFGVGAGTLVTAAAPGHLYLAVNEPGGTGGSGGWTVDIQRGSRPAPPP